MATIGFVGPGIMGAPMIRNLVAQGHVVHAHGRSDRSRERIVASGATAAATAADVVPGADLVITMLPDSPDVEAVLFGGDDSDTAPIADSLQPHQIFVDMSTIRPASSRMIHDRLAASGVAALDAPVSGGEAGAIEGSLSIMVGGDEATLTRARPILSAMGSTITHVGPAGSGQLTKAANQLVVAANIQAVTEAFVLLESAGADVAEALTALQGGLAGSTVLDRKRDQMLAANHQPGFRVALHNKDLRIVQDTVSSLNLGLPVTAAVSQLMRATEARGEGDLDHSALLRTLRHLHGMD